MFICRRTYNNSVAKGTYVLLKKYDGTITGFVNSLNNKTKDYWYVRSSIPKGYVPEDENIINNLREEYKKVKKRMVLHKLTFI